MCTILDRSQKRDSQKRAVWLANHRGTIESHRGRISEHLVWQTKDKVPVTNDVMTKRGGALVPTIVAENTGEGALEPTRRR